jgi:AraC-like DNA-binding protein
VIFPEEYLQMPLRYAAPTLARIMIGTGQRLMENYRQETNIANETRALICELLPTAQQDMDSVVQRMGMSGYQLSRRLQGAGYRFPDLVEEVRQDLAGHYLASADLALTDIAFLLGFSEQSAFTRAFRRWTGETPAQVRKRLREEGAGQGA